MDKNGDISMIILTERDITQLNKLKEKLAKTKQITEKLKRELSEKNLTELKDNTIIAESESMKQVIQICVKLAYFDASNILILGESGTGKGLLAKFIHKNSPRKSKPFVKINCAAIPEFLLEAELFGYEKGAFSGASSKGKAGLFELSHEGTLFLDEIGELPITVQAKLLSYLDDNVITHLGGTQAIKINSMIIAATNQDLKSLVAEKKFRSDLFHRLDAFSFTIPALKDRPEDINKLILHYLEKYNDSFNTNKKISSVILSKLDSHPFPGNVREIKNKIKKAIVLSDSEYIDEFLKNEFNL